MCVALCEVLFGCGRGCPSTFAANELDRSGWSGSVSPPVCPSALHRRTVLTAGRRPEPASAGDAWLRVPALPLTGRVTSGKLPNLSLPKRCVFLFLFLFC